MTSSCHHLISRAVILSPLGREQVNVKSRDTQKRDRVKEQSPSVCDFVERIVARLRLITVYKSTMHALEPASFKQPKVRTWDMKGFLEGVYAEEVS